MSQTQLHNIYTEKQPVRMGVEEELQYYMKQFIFHYSSSFIWHHWINSAIIAQLASSDGV